ncbi:hypothetical protein tb265_49350 [Gemmatimonadetes bacterium T265]|nr:hypothetical protein tb265_49350 [Gemmatimonadetes bacterium T265]
MPTRRSTSSTARRAPARPAPLVALLLCASGVRAAAQASAPSASPAPAAHASPAPDPLAPLGFLVGRWVSLDGPGPVRSRGTFAITRDLGGKVLSRRDHTVIVRPRTGECDTLDVAMTIFPDPAGGGLRAMHFDSEGHVIAYAARPGTPAGVAQFVSAGGAGAPTFRLTYAARGADTLHVTFEMARPDAPDRFTTYAEGSARRARDTDAPRTDGPSR